MSVQVVPSQMSKQLYMARTKAAEKGHDLLKKKNDSLKKKLHQIMKALIEKKKQLRGEFAAAYLAIAESEWSAGDFYGQVRDQAVRPSFTLDIRADNIAGVQLPAFEVREGEVAPEKIGRGQGGAQIENARARFARLLRVIVEVASLQTSFVKLDRVIQTTSRRVNALEFVLLPRFKRILAYIHEELDEQAREEKFMMKKVLDHRRRAQAERDRAFAAKKVEARSAPSILVGPDELDNLFG